MKKVLGIAALMGVASAVNAGISPPNPQPATLISVTSYSNNGFSAWNRTADTSTWTFDAASPGAAAVQTGGSYSALSKAGATPLMRHTMTGVTLGSGAPTGATWACIEGTFGGGGGNTGGVGASICGNYNFGANQTNQSTYTPTTTGASVSIGGDDGVIGPPQTLVTSYSSMLIFPLAGAPVGSQRYCFSNTNASTVNERCASPIVSTSPTTGYDFVFEIVLPGANDDGPIAATEGVATVIPVGSNDTGFANPVTVTVTTPPTKGTITSINNSPGPAAGVTITYTANIGATGTDTFVYDMSDSSPFTDPATVTVNISPALAPPDITSPLPPAGTAGAAYTYTYTATGSAPITYSLTNGSLPPGLTLSSAGVISGTPTTAGTSTGTVTASNGTLPNDTQDFSIAVTAAPSITSAAPPAGTLAAPYSYTYTATGSVPVSYSVTGGSLPPGLTLSSAGVITGTPTTLGTYTGIVTASNGTLPNATQGFSIVVSDVPDEVLVIDGGSSAVDPWSLAFLGGLPLLRRRRKAVLKLAAAAATVAAAVSLLAGPAGAADMDGWDWNYDGAYLGLGVNGTALETSNSFNSELDGLLGLASGGGSFEDFPVGLQAYAGWMFNRYLGLEGRWSVTDDGESDILAQDVITGDRRKVGDVEVNLDGVTAYGVANWPVVQRLDLFGKLGYTWQNADAKISLDGFGSASDSSNDHGVAAALGARWRFAHHFAATLEGEYLDVDFDDSLDEPWRTSLNVEYWFGGHEVVAPPPPAPVAAAPPPPPARVAAAPKDSDGDGVVDGMDKCPETPRGDRVSSTGCSCDVSRQLQFKSGSADLTDADKQILDEMAADLTRLNFVSGTIEGHTDSAGSDAFNQKLSERRANTVAEYLQSKGIAGDRMQVVGRGESDPVGDNKTAEGRAMNRRVVAKRTDCDK